MNDMRALKSLLADVFDEHPVHYTEVDMLGEDVKNDNWGTDPQSEADIALDARTASTDNTRKVKKNGHGKDRESAMVNIARGFEVNIHKDFDKYNNPDKYPKKTDGAKSVLPEHEAAVQENLARENRSDKITHQRNQSDDIIGDSMRLNEGDYNTFWIIAADHDGNRGMYEVSPGYRQWVFTLEYGNTVEGLDNAMVSDRTGPNEVRRQLQRDLDFVSEPFTSPQDAEEVWNDSMADELYDARDIDRIRELSGLSPRIAEDSHDRDPGHPQDLVGVMQGAIADGELDPEVMSVDEMVEYLSQRDPDDWGVDRADVERALRIIRKDEDMLVPPGDRYADVEEAAPLAVAAVKGMAAGAARATGSIVGPAAASALSGSNKVNESTSALAMRAGTMATTGAVLGDAMGQKFRGMQEDQQETNDYILRYEDESGEVGQVQYALGVDGFRTVDDILDYFQANHPDYIILDIDEDLQEDLQNGYGQHHEVDPDDLFPSGATSPRAKRIGPGGRGDNRLATRNPRNSENKVIDESALMKRYESMYRTLLESDGMTAETAARELLDVWSGMAPDVTTVDSVDAEELVDMSVDRFVDMSIDQLGIDPYVYHYVRDNREAVVKAVKEISGLDSFEAGGDNAERQEDPWNF